MSNQLTDLIAQWYAQRRDAEWVLGTVYKTEGSSYRKAGAMMLFGSQGQQLGLLSGGCLESDIQRQARKVMQTGSATTLCYDGSDEDDLSFQLGIGCGGIVHIVLQPITPANGFLGLEALYQSLRQRRGGVYFQRIPRNGEVEARFVAVDQTDTPTFTGKSRLIQEGDAEWLQTPIIAEPHLLIAGGGLDARPVAAFAHNLGWRVSVWDPRPANARAEFFMSADAILRCPAEELADLVDRQRVDAAVLMAHSITLDAAALKVLQAAPLRYLAMLGPRHRRAQVLEAAGTTTDALPFTVAGPAGLDIGGELPESIALSILAEAHAALHRRQGSSLSGVLAP